MVIDSVGYRLNVGIILVNKSGKVFWGKRQGHDAWQFPQGGLRIGETTRQAMLRELKEETGLGKEDIRILGCTKKWLKYRLPKQYLRHESIPLVIGQKQKWYLLQLLASDQKIRLDISESPEFDRWCWIDYHETEKQVIFFKRQVYALAIQELKHMLKKRRTQFGLHYKRGNHS